MGVSTATLLVYGYVWEDEADLFGEDPAQDEREWEEVVARKRGILNPWDAYPSGEFNAMSYEQRRAVGDAWMAEHRAELDAWYAAKKAIAAEFGVEIDQHGSDEWSVPIVKISGAGWRPWRGYPQDLTGKSLPRSDDRDAKLAIFCH